MPALFELTEEQKKETAEWLATRPPVIQEMFAKKPPDRLYRIPSGHRVYVIAYDEDETVRVVVSGKYNAVVFDRQVFGIPLDDLVECDPPGPADVVGTLITDETQVKVFIEKHRDQFLKDHGHDHSGPDGPRCELRTVTDAELKERGAEHVADLIPKVEMEHRPTPDPERN